MVRLVINNGYPAYAGKQITDNDLTINVITDNGNQ
jgi:hypothetical protein